MKRLRSTTGSKPLTARELSELCGVDLKTVHTWVAQGHIAHFRTPGRHLRFEAEEVERFLGGRAVSSVARHDPRGPLLFVVAPQTRASLRTALRSLKPMFAECALAALLQAGRERPSRIVLDATALREVDPLRYARVLRKELPFVRLFWHGAGKPRALSTFVEGPLEGAAALLEVLA